ncbi:hypothetical protein, partial [Escherichia coli]|uniref:hypothetical protein n=1 Tax=Escherichia coli TaxID=562 RepID=UPI00195465CA
IGSVARWRQGKCKTVTLGLPFFMVAPSPVGEGWGEGIRPLIHFFLFLHVIANLFLFFNHRLAFWHAAFIKTLHKRAGR